jgi:Ser/Thr protein kinase RdoA (MazF antagonist)
MWNQTLKKIDHTITPFIAARYWGADDNSVKLVSDGINLVYRFEVNGAGKYLRVTHQKIRPQSDLAAAIDFQLFLCSHGSPICQPIPSNSGRYIEEVDQGDLKFLVHATNEVPGQVINLERTERSMYEAWGKSLAQIHLAASKYQPAPQHKYMTWQKLWKETAGYLINEDDDLKSAFQLIKNRFNELSANDGNFGLTHGDHRTGNVLYDGHEIHIIDFDEPVYHWYLADIAKPFLELPNTPFVEWQEKFEWFIHGYRTTFPISDEEINNLKWFTQMKSLDIYLWCKNNWFEPTAPGGKPRDQWLQELRQMALKPVFSF